MDKMRSSKILNVLKYLNGHKRTNDLHSAVFYGTDVIFVEALGGYDFNMTIYGTDSQTALQCNIAEAVERLVQSEVVRYEI